MAMIDKKQEWEKSFITDLSGEILYLTNDMLQLTCTSPKSIEGFNVQTFMPKLKGFYDSIGQILSRNGDEAMKDVRKLASEQRGECFFETQQASKDVNEQGIQLRQSGNNEDGNRVKDRIVSVKSSFSIKKQTVQYQVA